MKSTVFFALALAALLLGHQQESQPQPASTEAAVAAGMLESASLPAQAQRQAPRRTEAPAGRSPGLAAASRAAVPPPGPRARTEAPPSLPIVAPDSGDWRDSALDLLSQIGVLCPASGCDSLEDD